MVFLSAGHLSLRKGTPYLLKAWADIKGSAQVAQLYMLGRVMLPPAMLQHLPPNVALQGHVSAADLDALYEKAAVLIVPSLCEGLAHVIPEAMSRGLAVIATPESGAEGLVEDGRNGWIIPARDARTLAERISWCIENPEEVRNMGQNSLIKAQQWSLEQATKKHVDAVIVLGT
jgi:glycosyltransferase involved in cell wall biosynthesis